MNYVKSFDLFGVPATQIPATPGSGAPTTATEGAVGCLYMDTNTGDLYKCTAVVDGVYTWVCAGGNTTERKYGKLLVLGDSHGNGMYNDDYSFVDVLSESGAFSEVVKACVNGACVGPYNTWYEADGYNLVEQVERYAEDIQTADIIICEYGGNDVLQIMDGAVDAGTLNDGADATTICGYLNKAITRIYELNPTVALHWLYVFPREFSTLKAMVDDNVALADAIMLFDATVIKMAQNKGCLILNPYSTNRNMLASDRWHANNEGQRLTALYVLENLYSQIELPIMERLVTFSGDTLNGTDLSFDGTFDRIKKLVDAGVRVKMDYTMDLYGGTTFHGDVVLASPYVLVFNATYCHDGTNVEAISVVISSDDSVSTSHFTMNGGLSTEAANLLIEILRNGVYSTDQSENITALATALSVTEPDEPEPPVEPEVTLTSISATYSGGDVAVGTAVSELTGIVVTAHYSDGTSKAVTGYTLSGTITEGSNTITVSYGGKTTTFTVTGVAESEPDVPSEDIPADATRLAGITSSGTQYIDTGIVITPYMGLSSVWDIPANPGSDKNLYGAKVTGKNRTYACIYSGTQVYFGFCCTTGGQTQITPSIYSQNNVRITTGVGNQNPINQAWGKPHTIEYAGTAQTYQCAWQPEPAAEPINLYLFAENSAGAASGNISATLKEFIVYSDEALTNEVMHLVPVRDADGVVCVYDTVGKQYLYNSGTGDFTAVEVA